jgi:hypothetical protein
MVALLKLFVAADVVELIESAASGQFPKASDVGLVDSEQSQKLNSALDKSVAVVVMKGLWTASRALLGAEAAEYRLADVVLWRARQDGRLM